MRDLNLFGNNLGKIPDSFKFLMELESLDVGENQLQLVSSLPATIKRLSLTNNQLHVIDKAILELTKLEELNLYNNPISELTQQLTKLKKLACLNIDQTTITHIPDFLFEMQALSRVYISKKQTFNKSLWSRNKIKEVHESNYYLMKKV